MTVAAKTQRKSTNACLPAARPDDETPIHSESRQFGLRGKPTSCGRSEDAKMPTRFGIGLMQKPS